MEDHFLMRSAILVKLASLIEVMRVGRAGIYGGRTPILTSGVYPNLGNNGGLCEKKKGECERAVELT